MNAKKQNIFWLLLGICLLVSCSNDDVDISDFLYWNQTGCSDPWEAASNSSDNLIISSVREYLKDQGVPISKISIENENSNGPFCHACHCLTGKRILVLVPRHYVNDLIALGFKRME